MAQFHSRHTDSTAFRDALPSLSAALLHNLRFRDATRERMNATSSLDQYPFARLEPMRILSNSDWDELLGNVEPIDHYVSPDISSLLQAHNLLEGSQELDLTGREFLSSPAIPVIGTVPKTFLEMLVPARLLEPIQSRQQPARGATSRYALREKPRAATQMLRTYQIMGLRPPTGAPAVPTRPLILRKNPSGKSARARLFASPTSDDKENRHANSTRVVEPATKAQPTGRSTKPTQNQGKRPMGHGRRSLDSAMPAPARPPVHRASHSARRFKDCSVDGCTKAARSRGFCKRHGGGKRCTFPDCTRSDQGGGLCIGHGGGKRCSVVECTNSAQSRGLCKSHGGGRRCEAVDCTKSAQLGGYCRTHGVGVLCTSKECAAHGGCRKK